MRAAMRFYHPRTASIVDRLIEPLDRCSRRQVVCGIALGVVAIWALLVWAVMR